MLLSFARQSLAGLRVLLALTLVTGVLYPLAVLLVAQGLFPRTANGSLVTADGRVVGSSLIGQSVDDPRYFWPRPSAAGDGYDALASGASNLGPENPELVAQVRQRRADVAAADGVDPADVPPDALTASGSGLDPHISPAYARQQVARVARARGVGAEQVAELVDAHTQGRQLGFLGEPRVNVLELNLALDGLRG
jgi:K+-transporting ATPase ATPase C chain